MKTIILYLLLITLFLSCNLERNESKFPKTDHEIDIINSTISKLVPEFPLCIPMPIQGESKNDYSNRIKKMKMKLDSTGKALEINKKLVPIHPIVIDQLIQENKNNNRFELLKNAPKTEKNIDFSLIKDYENVKVKESKSSLFIFDCYTIGVIGYSRMAFNKDSTFAIFQYSFSDGSCMGGRSGTVMVEKKGENWIIIK